MLAIAYVLIIIWGLTYVVKNYPRWEQRFMVDDKKEKIKHSNSLKNEIREFTNEYGKNDKSQQEEIKEFIN